MVQRKKYFAVCMNVHTLKKKPNTFFLIYTTSWTKYWSVKFTITHPNYYRHAWQLLKIPTLQNEWAEIFLVYFRNIVQKWLHNFAIMQFWWLYLIWTSRTLKWVINLPWKYIKVTATFFLGAKNSQMARRRKIELFTPQIKNQTIRIQKSN